MKKFCGCIELTTGVKIIGIFYAIYSIIPIIICSVGIADYPAFRDYIKSIWPDWMEYESGLLDRPKLNPIIFSPNSLQMQNLIFSSF
jgi:hypothetical protein